MNKLVLFLLLLSITVRAQVTKSVLPGGDTLRKTVKYDTIKMLYKPSSAVTYKNQSNFTIAGLQLPSINLQNCSNVIIRYCRIGSATVPGINLYNCQNVLIDSSSFYAVTSGVYATLSSNITVSNCQGKNMMGPYPRGQFVQFNQVSGGKIINNRFENILGASNPEDAINIYKSNGTAANSILISGNQIRGGGPSKSGSGILVGDHGGSYITVQNNILVDPGQVGIGVAGGTFINVSGNTIYAKKQSFTNVGLYYWNQSGLPSYNITIAGNQINFTNAAGKVSNSWLGTTPAPTGWTSNIFNSNLSGNILPLPLTGL